MKLGDLLAPDRVRVPLEARTLEEAFAELAGLLPEGHGERARTTPHDRGEPSPSGVTRIRFLPEDADHDPLVAIGIAPGPLPGGEGERASAVPSPEPRPGERPAPPAGEPSETPPRETAPVGGGGGIPRGERGARIIVLVEGGALGTVGRQRLRAAFFPAEVEEALLRAETPQGVLTVRRLAEFELERRLRVEDVMVPLSYRIYPDTPVDEVLDLIARRRLDAVPVVDESLQVLGVISAADALQHALRRRGKPGGAGRGTGEEGPTARDIMTRSVLCVAEDQELLDAAQLMANREAAQLPVVREGEMVGFLTRDGVLSALFRMEGGRERTGEPAGESDT